jgi:hypothetical protein
VAEKLDHDVWQDINNNIVQTETEAYGRKTRYSLLHPEKLVFVDEVGENISQKGDGNVGGRKFIVVKDMRAQEVKFLQRQPLHCLGFHNSGWSSHHVRDYNRCIKAQSNGCDRVQSLV